MYSVLLLLYYLSTFAALLVGFQVQVLSGSVFEGCEWDSCVEITGSSIAPKDLSVELFTESGTAEGKRHHLMHTRANDHSSEDEYSYTCLSMSSNTCMLNFDSGGADYISVATEITFRAGSMKGNRQCVNITALRDGIVEPDEQFSIFLTSESSDIQIENGKDTQIITLRDVDGKMLN